MTCPVCQGSGWQLLEREGRTAVVRCSCHRDSPDNIRTAGFFAIRKTGPVDFVSRYNLYRSSTAELRRILQKNILASDQGPSSERRVHFVR